ncbi:MAG: hypothetical protein H0T85_03970, partial [Geodermatophilaceae bacterium]|nr:hypothetical protein [Geodermatophilaceae bacterium]
ATDSRFVVLRQLIFAHVSAGRLDAAGDLLTEARPLAEALGTPEAEMALLYLEHFRCECAGEIGPRRRLVEQAGDLVRRHPHPALRARYLGMRIVQHLHCGEAGLFEQAAAELVQLGAGTGDPYSSWLGLSARVVGPLLEGDLGSAAQLAEQAYLHANESDLFAGDSAWAGQLVVLGWVSGRLTSFQRPQEAPDLEGPEFAWSAVRALFLALSGDADNATAILAELTPGIGTVGAQWIGSSTSRWPWRPRRWSGPGPSWRPPSRYCAADATTTSSSAPACSTSDR